MKNLLFSLLALSVVSAAQASMGDGDVVAVDFGDGGSLANYNVISDTTTSIADLSRLSDGSSTGVSLATTADAYFMGSGYLASTDTGLDFFDTINTANSTVYADGLISNTGGSDTITLTFTGLDDSLEYDLVGGLSRESNPANFGTRWTIDGVDAQSTDGSASGGYVEFKGLSTTSPGTLVITLTDTGTHAAVSQLSLVASGTPSIPSSPELPADEVVAFFDPIVEDASATVSEINDMTIGGTWSASLPTSSLFAENTGGYAYALNGASAQGDYMELTLDNGGLDFSTGEVAINFQMLSTRAATAGNKHTTVIGYDGSDEIFRLKYTSVGAGANNAITVTTEDGEESMGFTPLRHVAQTTTPSGFQDFSIVLSGGEVAFSGSSLTAQSGAVLNSGEKLTSLRWEITGSNTSNQGFWLDDLQIRDGLPAAPRAPTDRPNVIFILMDDMGYSDVSTYGASRLSTPNIDGLASDGLKFTTFVLPGNVCSPTRASFLTGAYPSRCGMPFAHSNPYENHWFLGLDPDEITIAEQCRSRGYKTCMIGKWHLGDQTEFLPHNQGFDRYFGTHGNSGSVYDETEVAYSSLPQSTLTSLYTQRIREHIREYRDRPFFIYYPHNYPHTPYTEGNAFDGSTGSGERSDVIKELDWSIGQMVAELEANGILENTLIIFTSDNGAVPPASYGNAPFRGAKYVTWEGGHRVPFIMYWKGQIDTPAELADPQVWAMDVFPTVSELAGAPMPTDRVYDGTSLVPLLSNQPIARAADAPFYYYSGDNLQCVRKGDWKLHVPRTEYQLPWWDQIKPPPSDYQLYDLSIDPDESDNVADANPAIVAELTALAASIREELGDSDSTDGSLIMGSGQRGTGTLFPEVPIILNENSDYNYVPDWNSLTAVEKGRAVTRRYVDNVGGGADFIDGTVLPYSWEFLNADEASGGNEVAMTPGISVGTQGNTGFVGAGSAGLIGSASTASFVINSENTGNGATEGEDLLIATDDNTDRDFVIVRYTVTKEDISFGKTRANVSGSFRDLVGDTDDASVTTKVYLNDDEVFTATGSAGRLSKADGTFGFSAMPMAVGDTISFVIGSNGSNDGDEVALQISMEFDLDTSVTAGDLWLSMKSSPFVAEGIAGLEFKGKLGLSYRVEQSLDLGATDSWETVEQIPFLTTSPYDVFVESEADDERAFWRVVRDE